MSSTTQNIPGGTKVNPLEQGVVKPEGETGNEQERRAAQPEQPEQQEKPEQEFTKGDIVESETRAQTEKYFTRMHEDFKTIKETKKAEFATLFTELANSNGDNHYLKIGKDKEKLQKFITETLGLKQDKNDQELARDIANHVGKVMEKIEPIKEIDKNTEERFVNLLDEAMNPKIRMETEYISPYEAGSWYNTTEGKGTLAKIEADAERRAGK